MTNSDMFVDVVERFTCPCHFTMLNHCLSSVRGMHCIVLYLLCMWWNKRRCKISLIHNNLLSMFQMPLHNAVLKQLHLVLYNFDLHVLLTQNLSYRGASPIITVLSFQIEYGVANLQWHLWIISVEPISTGVAFHISLALRIWSCAAIFIAPYERS